MLSPLISYFETFRKFVRQKDPIGDGKKQCGPVQLIEFRNVSFSYADGSMVLKNLSFSVGRNERIAIVGENGSGKSTLIKLLCRFYDPHEGAIFINGINLKEIDLSSWRKQLSVIFQDFGKYPLTLEENIGIADPMHLQDDNRLLQALSKGELASLIQKFPEGMKTILGKEFSGKELSFGEWQKLAIGRLFFRDSPIVALDEPTASLDPNAEHEIFQQLLQAFEGKIVFLITHRLNSVRACDRILLLKGGAILEDGVHLDLMLQKGEYYRLFSLQAQGYQAPEEAYASL
jgi:ATP-binding cassette subfamily B protein